MEDILESQDFENTPYSMLELLGSGTYGKVYKCVKRVSGKVVAVKVPKHYTAMDKRERRFLKKVCRKGDPDKVNIINLLDVIKVRGVPSLVMEFFPCDLSVFLRSKGPMPISQVRCLGIQLLSAITFLQFCKIVHGDIKPPNIMCCDFQGEDKAVRIKLIDLGGFEVSEDSPPEVWRELTSLFYRSPEVVMGLPASFPVDVWAVIVVCLEAFMETIPFPAASNKDLMAHFHKIFEKIPEDLLKGKYAREFFEEDSDGVFSIKVATPHFPCPLGYEFDGLMDFADLECDSYKNDTACFLDFLKMGLCLSPKDRITAEKALEEDFFTSDHFLCDGSNHEKEAHQMLKSLRKTSSGLHSI